MIYFIVNPIAGNGNGLKVWRKIEQRLMQSDQTYTTRQTTRSGEARLIAAEVISTSHINCTNIRAIVVVGGDGTVSEVAGGIIDALHANETLDTPPPIGYIPAGSGNDFARGHHLPQQPLDALQLILDSLPNQITPIDLLQCGSTIAVNSIGAGFDGKVAYITNHASYKNWLSRLKLGKVAYIVSLIRGLIGYQPCDIRLTIDGVQHEFRQVWLVSVTNHPYFGGGMKFCPQAVPDDGYADIFVVHHVSKTEFLRVFPQVYSGKHVHHPAVTFFQGREIEIETSHPCIVQADGEYAGSTPLSIQIRQHTLPLIHRRPE